VFIPYGAFPSEIRPSSLDQQSAQLFINQSINLTIGAKWAGLKEFLPKINSEIKRQQNIQGLNEFGYAGKILYYQLLAIGIVICFAFLIMLVFVDTFGGPSSTLMKIGRGKILLYGAPFALLLFIICGYLLEFTKRFVPKEGMEVHMDTRIFGSVVAILVLMTLIGLALDSPISREVSIDQDQPPRTSSFSEGIIEDETLQLVDNIYVRNGTSLTIKNSTIAMRVLTRKSISIFVAERGQLQVIDSNISSNTKYGYVFEIYGTARFENSYFSGLFAPEDGINGDGGIEIYSDDVSIVNCTIAHNLVNGILIKDSSPTIENCTFENNEDDAIEIHHSGARITNCTFRNNNWGMVIFSNSYCAIIGNHFLNNTHGIFIQSEDVTLRDNIFENNSKNAIILSFGFDVDTGDSIFQGNGEDVRVQKGTYEYGFSLCNFIIFSLAVIFAIVIYLVTEKRIGREPTMTIEEVYRIAQKQGIQMK